jgi:hypothetical protein
MTRALSWTLCLALATAAIVSIAAAQAPAPPPPAASPLAGWSWPEHMRNVKVLPKSTTADQLRDTMKGFAIGLGVRCTFCHTGTEQMPFVQRDFPSDANPRKNKARAMMRMVDRLNRDIPAIVGRDARVTCYTCHRGAPKPATDPPLPPMPPASAR